jgi:hypothetical protein
VTEIIQSRRGFIAGLGALFIAAPAIVRATSIMPVKAIRQPTLEEVRALLKARMEEAFRVTRESIAQNLYAGYGGGFTFNHPDYVRDGESDYKLREYVVPIELPPELA